MVERTDLDERIATVPDGYVIEDQGLSILRPLTAEEWTALGTRLVRRHQAALWALGDWLAYGTGRDAIRGKTYHAAVRATGYSESHLSNLYQVAKSFPRTARVAGLTWSHHRAVLACSKRDTREALLQKALQDQWGVYELEQRIPIEERRETAPALSRHKGVYHPREVRCPHCQQTFPIKGHKV